MNKNGNKFLDGIKKGFSFINKHRKYFISGLCLFLIAGFALNSSPGNIMLLPGTKFAKPELENTEMVTSDDFDENGNEKKPEEEEEEENKLELTKNKELNEFFRKYYAALATGNPEKIRKFVDVLNDVEIANIKNRAKYLEKFQNIRVYTKKGPEEDTLMAYVYVELKFKNVKTAAPGIEPYYVKKDTDGYVIINSMNANMEVMDYVTEEDSAPDVAELFRETDKAFNKAMEDKNLVKFFKETGIYDNVSDEIKAEAEKKEAEKKRKAEEKKKAEAEKKKAEKKKKDAEKKKKSSSDKKKSDKQKTDKKKSNKKKSSKNSKGVKVGKKIKVKDSIRLRAKKTTKSDVKATAVKGDTITVVKTYENSQWVKVKLTAAGKDYYGYMMKKYLK